MKPKLHAPQFLRSKNKIREAIGISLLPSLADREA